MILSNVSTPLLGLVDTAVIGNQGRVEYIGAVAVGASILTFLYWIFSFLQMGTSGLTAQADGAGEDRSVTEILLRGLMIGSTVGLVLIVLQWPLLMAGIHLMAPPAAEADLSASYLFLRIWSAPAALSNLVLLGWFVGQRKTRTALLLQVFLNGTNLVLNLLFVLGFGLGVIGIALGTLIADVLACGLGIFVAERVVRARTGASLISISPATVFNGRALRRMVLLNRDIMIRTFCLLFAFSFFVRQGAQLGSVPLAANAILQQFMSFSAFFLDGFAVATETLAGQAIGAARAARVKEVLRKTSIWAGATAIALSSLFALAGPLFIDLLTNVEDVRALAKATLGWLILMPLLGVWSFQLDGLFFGATKGPQMRNAAILALMAFLVAWALLMAPFGLTGLWAALMVYYVARAVFLAVQVPRLLADIPAAPTASESALKPSDASNS